MDKYTFQVPLNTLIGNQLIHMVLFSPPTDRFGTRHAGRTHNYFFKRLAALEARAVKRTSVTLLLYLPIIFFGYGFLLGIHTINYYVRSPLQGL